MRSKLIHEASGQRTWALIFDAGDEVMAGIKSFAEQNHLVASHFTAIGALSRVTLGYFEWDKKQYKKIPIQEQVEVASLVGDIAENKGKPAVHAHVVVGRSDGSAAAGHLVEAHVRPTLELILTESPAHLRKQMDSESGLALIRP